MREWPERQNRDQASLHYQHAYSSSLKPSSDARWRRDRKYISLDISHGDQTHARGVPGLNNND